MRRVIVITLLLLLIATSLYSQNSIIFNSDSVKVMWEHSGLDILGNEEYRVQFGWVVKSRHDAGFQEYGTTDSLFFYLDLSNYPEGYYSVGVWAIDYVGLISDTVFAADTLGIDLTKPSPVNRIRFEVVR